MDSFKVLSILFSSVGELRFWAVKICPELINKAENTMCFNLSKMKVLCLMQKRYSRHIEYHIR